MTKQLALAWSNLAPNACARLRALLADGEWKTQQQLTKAGGARFGARLLELRTGEDGGPALLIEKKSVNGDVVYVYRCAGVAGVPQQTRTVAFILAELRKEVAHLKKLNEELEKRLDRRDGDSP